MIKAPTLVILGVRDGLVGSATAAATRARNIAGCEIEILPRAGHVMHVDEPEFVAERIVNFLEVEKSNWPGHTGSVFGRSTWPAVTGWCHRRSRWADRQ